MREDGVDKNTLWTLLAILPVCSFAGLAALLRTEQPITRRAVLAASLNSGLFGLAVAAAMVHRFGAESIYLILSVSVLSGLGGNAALDFAIEGVKAYVRKHE